MFRTSILASLIIAFPSIAAFAEEARQLDLYWNDDRAKRDVTVARDRSTDAWTRTKDRFRPWERRGERPQAERQ